MLVDIQKNFKTKSKGEVIECVSLTWLTLSKNYIGSYFNNRVFSSNRRINCIHD